MALPTASDNPFPSLLTVETAAASIGTPAAGRQRLFVDTDHVLKYKNSSGTVTAVGAASGYSTVQDEGTPLTQRSTMNFVGAGVTAADSGGVTTVTIGGGGGGAMTQLYDNTVTGSSVASWDVTGISGSYNHLKIVIYGRGTNAAGNINVRFRINNDSSSLYDYQNISGSGSSAGAFQSTGQAFGVIGDLPAASATAGNAGGIEGLIANYTGAIFKKAVVGSYYQYGSAQGLGQYGTEYSATAAAITRLTFLPNAGNFDIGSRLTIYGLL